MRELALLVATLSLYFLALAPTPPPSSQGDQSLSPVETSKNESAPTKESVVHSIYSLYLGEAGGISVEVWGKLLDDAKRLEQRGPNDDTFKMLVLFINGELAKANKQFDLARDDFRTAIAANSKNALPFLGLAELALEQANRSEADMMLQVAEFFTPQSVPEDFQALFLARVGELYARAGKYMAAVEAYETAISKKPNWGQGERQLAQAQLSLDEAASALRHIEKAISVEPLEASNYSLLGMARRQLGDSSSAVEAFRQAIELDPQNAFFHYQLGTEHESRGERIAALRSYLTALELVERRKAFTELLPQLRDALSRLR